jgi:hypothetical protein
LHTQLPASGFHIRSAVAYPERASLRAFGEVRAVEVLVAVKSDPSMPNAQYFYQPIILQVAGTGKQALTSNTVMT